MPGTALDKQQCTRVAAAADHGHSDHRPCMPRRRRIFLAGNVQLLNGAPFKKAPAPKSLFVYVERERKEEKSPLLGRKNEQINLLTRRALPLKVGRGLPEAGFQPFGCNFSEGFTSFLPLSKSNTFPFDILWLIFRQTTSISFVLVKLPIATLHCY